MSFNAHLRDELLNVEIFYTLREAQIVIQNWRRHYNAVRPHASMATGSCPRRCSCASARRMARCITPTSSAGHAPTGATADPKLTFQPDR